MTNIFLVMLFSAACLSCSEDPSESFAAPPGDFTTADLTITNIAVGSASGKHRMITFDIQWSHSWRTGSSPNNWDAAWIFVKYRVRNGDWKHATLSTVSAEHSAPAGSTISPPSDGKGIFLYRSENGTGLFRAASVSLRWNYGLDRVDDDVAVSVRVLGIEMIYIPQGSFYAGDNGQSVASFTKGSNDKRPWHITSEEAIEVTNTTSNGYYYTSSKDFWNDRFNAHEDPTGTSFVIPADFPKGYRAVYCMKYEMTQQQYVEFLNTLTVIQASNRYDRANANKYGYTISESNGVYSTTHPRRACGFLSPADGFAYADWAGLRPMSELEFEKICRGSDTPPVKGEYAWGTLYCKNARPVNGTEGDRATVTASGGNCYYSEENHAPQFPLNAGIFAGAGKTREKSGATYYGALEMSGNLNETCVSLGTLTGRVFTSRNGDGLLAPDGSANESHWPLSDGRGSGYRGGTLAREQRCLQVSDRTEASVEIDRSHRHIPWGFRCVRTVRF